MLKIKVLIPNSGMDRLTLSAREEMLSRALSSDCSISVDCIPRGPISIESNTDEIMAGSLVLEAAIRAEAEGYDAFIIYCFSDLAIDAIRENVRIPVIGPGETALSAAYMISNRFSVITTIESNIARTERRLLKNAAAREKMVSVHALNIPVADLRESPEITKRYLFTLCRNLTKNERIDCIILGCLGFAEYGKQIEKELGIKVIDPAFLAASWAEAAARIKLVHSRSSYSRRK